jgi:hypothetical protein
MTEREAQASAAQIRDLETQLAAAKAEARAFRTAYHSLRLTLEKHLEVGAHGNSR